ncbi:hypothetical protein BT69DRAFT_453637 [Atractiella rhizophila]|nr:hypothetical protein BT69DRAFT_453637 [Atractiella rhizophila]
MDKAQWTQINNPGSAVVSLATLGFAALWYLACIVIAAANREPARFKTRSSAVCAYLSVVASLVSTSQKWPQAQQNAALLLCIVAQAVCITFIDSENLGDAIEKLVNAIGLVIAAISVHDNSLTYDWELTHNPLVYVIISFVHIGLCLLFLWVRDIKRRARIITLINFIITCFVFGFAGKAADDMRKYNLHPSPEDHDWNWSYFSVMIVGFVVYGLGLILSTVYTVKVGEAPPQSAVLEDNETEK